MGLILDAFVRHTAMDHPHPDLRRCVNRNQRHLTCNACMEICPVHVYDVKQAIPPKWDACQNCGLCVSACPTRCIAPSSLTVKRHLLMAESQGRTVIACDRAKVKGAAVEACMALLPWELLAVLALCGGVSLCTKPCGECPHDECRVLLNKQLDTLKLFLGEASFNRLIDLDGKTDGTQSASDVDRREFFKSLAKGGKKTGALFAGDAAGIQADGLVYRRMLANAVKEYMEREKTDAPWRLRMPWFTEECYGCGICVLLCPNQAIEVSDEKDGIREMIVDAQKCTGCGVCVSVCRTEGVEGICTVRLREMTRLRLAKVKSASCEQCGRAIAPDSGETLCTACKIRKKR